MILLTNGDCDGRCARRGIRIAAADADKAPILRVNLTMKPEAVFSAGRLNRGRRRSLEQLPLVGHVDGRVAQHHAARVRSREFRLAARVSGGPRLRPPRSA